MTQTWTPQNMKSTLNKERRACHCQQRLQQSTDNFIFLSPQTGIILIPNYPILQQFELLVVMIWLSIWILSWWRTSAWAWRWLLRITRQSLKFRLAHLARRIKQSIVQRLQSDSLLTFLGMYMTSSYKVPSPKTNPPWDRDEVQSLMFIFISNCLTQRTLLSSFDELFWRQFLIRCFIRSLQQSSRNSCLQSNTLCLLLALDPNQAMLVCKLPDALQKLRFIISNMSRKGESTTLRWMRSTICLEVNKYAFNPVLNLPIAHLPKKISIRLWTTNRIRCLWKKMFRRMSRPEEAQVTRNKFHHPNSLANANLETFAYPMFLHHP